MTNTLKTALEAYKPELAGELEKRLNAQAKVHTQEINAAIAAEAARKREQELEWLHHNDPWKYRMKMEKKAKKEKAG